MAEDQEATPSIVSRLISTFTKIRQNITVEPLVACWLLPFLLTYAAIENMNLEKACRELVSDDKGFSKDVCKLFVRKDEYGIDCEGNENVQVEAIKERYPEIYYSYENNSKAVYDFLCESEQPAQDKLLTINSIRNPIASIGPLIIILFAGPWSDKKNLRVPCMLVPFLGEAIGYLSLFIAAIFINGPVEFPAYTYRLLPSLTGAENLMVLGIFSYLSAISSEENRTFRFGIFQIIMTILPIIAQSVSPTLIKNYEYAELFGAMIPVHVFGFLYAIFYLKEVKMSEKATAAYDNQAMTEDTLNSNNVSTLEIDSQDVKKTGKKKYLNAVKEFFDPQLATKCISSLLKKRENGLRKILIIFMVMHLLCNGISQGEAQNLFLYVRAKLSWDVSTYVYHNVFTAVCGLIGTSFAVGLLSKILKVADIHLVLMSTLLSIVCRGIYFGASKTSIFFTGTAIDFTFSVKFLGVRSLISKIVPSDDLSTMFAVMGLMEALAGFVFPIIYPMFYQFLLKNPDNHDVAEIFLMSNCFLIVGFFVYIYEWWLLRKRENSEIKESKTEDNEKELEVTKF